MSHTAQLNDVWIYIYQHEPVRMRDLEEAFVSTKKLSRPTLYRYRKQLITQGKIEAKSVSGTPPHNLYFVPSQFHPVVSSLQQRNHSSENLGIDLDEIPWENHLADIVIKGAKKVIYTHPKTGEPMILLSTRADNTNIRVNSKYFPHKLYEMTEIAQQTSMWRSPIVIALLSTFLILSSLAGVTIASNMMNPESASISSFLLIRRNDEDPTKYIDVELWNTGQVPITIEDVVVNGQQTAWETDDPVLAPDTQKHIYVQYNWAHAFSLDIRFITSKGTVIGIASSEYYIY